MNVEYVIVGGGYAALLFAHQLIKNKRKFVILSDYEKSASQISAGVCNPVILKRFTSVWRAQEQLITVREQFREMAAYLGDYFVIEEGLVRIFHDEKEKELWLTKSDKVDLNAFLDKDFKELSSVDNKYGAGAVNTSCRIDVSGFFTAFYQYLEENQLIVKENFDFSLLDIGAHQYKDIKYDNIVFCEGVKVQHNPLFRDVPISGNKGHSMLISADINLDPYILKKKFFLFRNHDNLYFVGGTYERDQIDLDINASSVTKLKNGLEEIYKGDYAVNEVHTAFRAVVPDRRPVVGRHSLHRNCFILNGMGARGVMNSCFFSKALYDYIEIDKALLPEVDVTRFYQ